MKIRVLGFLIMLVGLFTIGYGISILSVADTEEAVAVEGVEPSLKTGNIILMPILRENVSKSSMTRPSALQASNASTMFSVSGPISL